ncbi:MAG: TetR/AcrR family transcriptional regulator, regulator of autoinduction and epiphytic fitness [Actinomycetota bacterium]|nr:TetR/AcrR family transcriptional regulator, regulator of autoinduction and epiphytic fitness [Actinomycetota bacterium]
MTETAVDGRTLRRERNLETAVDAMLDLLGEGHPQPTAQDVADRSGLSIRSIFRLFDDVESLYAAAVARQTERIGPLLEPVPPTGPLADRVLALAARRTALYEAIAPVRRSAMRQAATSPAVAAGLARADRVLRAQVKSLFADERPAAVVVEAVDAAASFETWDRLRTHQGLSRQKATQAVALMLHRLLTD